MFLQIRAIQSLRVFDMMNGRYTEYCHKTNVILLERVVHVYRKILLESVVNVYIEMLLESVINVYIEMLLESVVW